MMGFTKPADEFGIAETPAVFADDRRAVGDRNDLGQRDQPEIGCGLERRIPSLRPFAQQVEQLPELRFRRTFARGAVAQHSGKAVVEMHQFSGGIGRRGWGS